MSELKLTLIIANYNYGFFLPECIKSVMEQTHMPDEIIISDDASEDNSAEVLRILENEYPGKFKINMNKKNMGTTNHFNKVVSLAKNEVICIVGADNHIPKDYVKESMKLFADDIGIVYNDLILFGSKKDEEIVKYGHDWRHSEKDPYRVYMPEFDKQSKEMLFDGVNFIHGSAFYLKAAWEKAGMYQDKEIQEDFGLFLRILQNGYVAKKANTYLNYRQHSSLQLNQLFNLKTENEKLNEDLNKMSNLRTENEKLNEDLNQLSKQLNQRLGLKDLLNLAKRVLRKLISFLRKKQSVVPPQLSEQIVEEAPQVIELKDRRPNDPLLIAVVSPEPVYSKMAGPALRAFHIAKELAKHFDVVLFHQKNDDLKPSVSFIDRHCSDLEVVTYTTLDFNDIDIEKFDYFLSPTLGLDAIDKLVKSSVKIIYDFYNVLPIENLFAYNSSESEAKIKKTYWDMIRQMYLLALSGSHYLVSHDKQKDYWLGFLSAARRLDPKWCSIVDDKNLFSTLPFGIESNLPEKNTNVIRGKYKNIDEETVLLVWSGGVWNWFDAQTAIKGIAKLNENSSKKYVLFFYGVKHPNPAQSQLSELNATIELAKELGLYEEFVHFNFDWVDFDERYNYLLEADILISLHKDNLETNFSFRTRILDHLWVKKPTISTVGDYFANVIKENNIGKTVDYKSVDEFVGSVIELSSKKPSKEFIKSIEEVRTQFFWENTTKELIEKIKSDQIKPEIDPEFIIFRTLCQIEN